MTGTWEDFEGDDNLNGFEAILAEMLLRTELGGISDGYQLDHSIGISGYSFGGNQMDLSQNAHARTVLRDILTNARDGSNNLIFADGDAWYSARQTAIESAGSSTALSTIEQGLIEDALGSAYGKAAINSAFLSELSESIDHVNEIIASIQNYNVRTSLENSEELRAYLIDYNNQFYITPNGLMHSFLKGEEVTTYQNEKLQLNGMVTVEDLQELMSQTEYATNNPTPYGNRQDIVGDVLSDHEIGKYLSGNHLAQDFDGSEFDDYINGRGGIDIINAGAGNDIVVYRLSDHSSILLGSDVLDGGADTDVLKLEFRSDELTTALREEILYVYNQIEVDPVPGGFSYEFTNLNLEISNFEYLEIWVDGQQVSLIPDAVNNYHVSSHSSSLTGWQSYVTGYLLDNNFNALSGSNSPDSFAFANEISATAGTFTTVAGGTIIVNSNGSFAYTSPVDFYGQDSYTYTVTDASGVPTSATNYFVNQSEINSISNSYTASSPVEYKSVYFADVNKTLSYDPDTGKLFWIWNPDDTITGSSYADYISTDVGSDTVYGGAGDDIIAGGGNYHDGSNCVLNPTYAQVSLYGEDGDDTISNHINSGGDFYFSGGNGHDTISLNASASLKLTDSFGYNGQYSASVSEIYGDAGNDSIYVQNVGADTIYGGTGDDTIAIEIHGLTYVSAANGGLSLTQSSDVYNGGDGIDTISFNIYHADSSTGVNVDLDAEIVNYNGTDHDTISIENVYGSSLNDEIYGSDLDNILNGGAGNDELYGGAGDDVLDGGQDDDTFIINLNEGIDKIYDSDGNDKIIFGAGITAASLSYAKDKDDLIIRHNGVDLVRLVDHLHNADNVETIQFNDNSTLLLSQAFQQTLAGSTVADIIYTDIGNVTAIIDGLAGDDDIHGGIADDILHGGENDDNVYGYNGNDRIFGDDGADYLSGGNGDDVLDGGQGDDIVLGENNDDTLIYIYNDNVGDTDNYYGGAGNDTLELYFINDISEAIVDDIANYYSYLSNPSNINLLSTSGAEYLFSDFDLTAGRIENVKVFLDGWELDVSMFSNSIHGTNGNNSAINGTLGDDIIWGHGGWDAMAGDDGNDILIGGSSDDEMYGGDGDDVLIGGGGYDYMSGGLGSDTFVFHGSNLYDDGWEAVVDFDAGEGDVIYLSELLIDYVAGQSDINDYLSLTNEWNGPALTIDRDGLGSLYAGNDKIYSFAPSTPYDTIDSLVNNGNIVIA